MTAAGAFFVQTDALVGDDPIRIRRTVRWVECDPAGVVHTPRFLDYAVSAYEAFLGYLLGGPLHRAKAGHGIDFPAKAAALEFQARLTVDDQFEMTVRCGAIRQRTFDILVEAVTDAGAPAFRATLTPICFDPDAARSVAIPAAMRARLEAYARRHQPVLEGTDA